MGDDGRRDIAGVVRGGWTMHFSDAIIVYTWAAIDNLAFCGEQVIHIAKRSVHNCSVLRNDY